MNMKLLLLGLLFLLTFAPHAAALSLDTELLAIFMSRLAYAPTDGGREGVGAAAFNAVVDMYRTDLLKLKAASRALPSGPASRRTVSKAKAAKRIFSEVTILGATRDCVFAVRKHGKDKPELLFGFRGTAIASDLIVDAQLATNARSIGRLDEAREFVLTSIRRYMNGLNRKYGTWATRARRPVTNPVDGVGNSIYGRMWFFGHSLGGFIAEGAGSDYRQGRVVTFATGAPLFETPDGRPAAYGKPQNLRVPIRVVREADLVPMGVANLGTGRVVKRRAVEVKRAAEDSLDIFHNWLQADPEEERNFLSEASNSAALAVTSMMQKARSAIAQHSLTNDATWHDVVVQPRTLTKEEKEAQERTAALIRKELSQQQLYGTQGLLRNGVRTGFLLN